MIKHHFFGNNCKIDRELSNYSDLELCLKQKNWDFKNINFVNQIHSNEVYVIDSPEKIQGRQGLKKADGIVTNLSNLAIAVVTADCSPIIIKDEENKVAAIIHAGWRGAKSGIIENSITKIIELGGCKDHLQAYIGPMIHQKSYQVSKEFYDDFLLESEKNEIFFKKDVADAKFLFDLPGYIKNIIKNCGISRVYDANINTYLNCDNYASYRKSCHDSEKYSNCRNISIAMIGG